MVKGGTIRPDLVLTIAEGLDVVLLDSNEVLIQFGTSSLPAELLRDPNRRGILGPLLDTLMDGPATLSDACRKLGLEGGLAEFEPVIVDLVQRGILSEVASSPVEQYLRYTFTGESTLTGKRASIIGSGPIGARIAQSLLQHGVSNIIVLDDRETDPLWQAFQPLMHNRQAKVRDGSMPAHHYLRERLGGSRNGVEVLDVKLDAAGLRAVVANADLTVMAFEQPNLEVAHLLNRVCLKEKKAWMTASTDGNLGLIGPLFLPRETACYNCYAALSESAVPSREMSRRYRQRVIRRGAGSFFPGLPAFADIVAGYACLAAVHYLLGKGSFVAGRVLNINFDRMLIHMEDVLKLPRCPVCALERAVYRPPFTPGIVNPP